MRLQGAMLYVKDLPRMTAFYEMCLGARPVAETGGDSWVEFDSGGARFGLHAIPARIAAGIQISGPRDETPLKLIFAVADPGIEARRLEELGATVIQRPWGDFDVVDPEGNIFQLTARL